MRVRVTRLYSVPPSCWTLSAHRLKCRSWISDVARGQALLAAISLQIPATILSALSARPALQRLVDLDCDVGTRDDRWVF